MVRNHTELKLILILNSMITTSQHLFNVTYLTWSLTAVMTSSFNESWECCKIPSKIGMLQERKIDAKMPSTKMAPKVVSTKALSRLNITSSLTTNPKAWLQAVFSTPITGFVK